MIKVGVFFGGSSREREVSFAGGRTVYDNLDKNLFDAIPIFVDSYGNFAILRWEYVYRGTIRDFYPPVSFLPESPNQFQIYAESLGLAQAESIRMLGEIGTPIQASQLSDIIDFAFLALHGEMGEDGTIQGILEWNGIPYSGSGILASALGMNKAIQKQWLDAEKFAGPIYKTITREVWLKNSENLHTEIESEVGYPLVVKAANQGSSIGITILKEKNNTALSKALEKAFFTLKLSKSEWIDCDKVQWVREFSDIRNNIGFPALVEDELVYHPESALTVIEELFKKNEKITFTAIKPETEVVVERFIEGREFSCIVIRNQDGQPKALPPTEIIKKSELFDYRSKYLPGLSRKVTPIHLPDEELERIRQDCERLYSYFNFKVYARIDGFHSADGQIYLNDPNTTSGMMPSSFFFHQASEIGLNPSKFLSYIFRTSCLERSEVAALRATSLSLVEKFDRGLRRLKEENKTKIRVGVIMGGYSTERHISVESGRNIYEKLASSPGYEPIPIFLTGSDSQHRLFILPINVMLKDNADDIKAKVERFEQPEALQRIIREFSELTEFYTLEKPIFEPREITYDQLASHCDEIFIALHGRPGEDGAVQGRLDELGMPYNGSGRESSQMTIDKYETNSLLRQKGFLVADNFLAKKEMWESDPDRFFKELESMGFPLIAKPADEGCSSAVMKINSSEALRRYARTTFREHQVLSDADRTEMGLSVEEEFPKKPYFLVENYIDRKGADHFLEITGGLLTKMKDGQVEYEVFEPSEALAEGEILSLAEKFLAGEGQNITPARFSPVPEINASVSKQVRKVFGEVAKILNIEGYCRIDAFVRIFEPDRIEVIIIEINSLPGMTPATCIYHQAAINGYKPFEFIDKILTFGRRRSEANLN